MQKYNILNFGAIGDGVSDDSQSIQKAIDICAENGGGIVIINSGLTYLSGPFDLKSNITLAIQPGTTLRANPDEGVYIKSAFRENKGEGTIWIGGEDIQNVAITGGGTIDGNGPAFMGKEMQEAFELKPFDVVDPRPHLMTLVGARNIRINNITFKDAAYWGLHFVGCIDVLVNNVHIYNHLKIRNGDGIDLDHCKNVNISDCHIESGDDCICFKNRREYAEYGACKNITVTGCTLVSTSCAIKFGSENMDAIENVVISNCVIKDSNRGIGIQNRDEGSVSNVLISNIIMECRLFSDVWWGKAEPIYITSFPRATEENKDGGFRLPDGATLGEVGKVRDITISNVQCKSENGIFIAASHISKVQNIKLRNIDIAINKRTTYPGGIYDCRPCAGRPLVKDGTYAFYLQNVKKIYLKDCHVRWGKNRPDYYHSEIAQINCEEVEVVDSNFLGEDAVKMPFLDPQT